MPATRAASATDPLRSDRPHLQLATPHYVEVETPDRVTALRELLGESACRQLGIYPIPEGTKLSVVIPVFNERRWIVEVIDRVKAVPVPKEIIVVDDGSTDGTREILPDLEDDEVQVYLLPTNRGKGAAVREGFRRATGTIVLVQDADLEYDPAEYLRLIQPIIEDRADVVFGSRFLGDGHRVHRFWHAMANRALTLFSNMLTDLNLTDMETCYKVFRREVLDGLKLKSNRFGFEPEFTARIAKKKDPAWRVYEVPVSYSGRSYAEGKKIRARDALAGFYWIVRYWLFD